MEAWVIVTVISLTFTIPVLASAYYSLILLISSLRYPKSLGRDLVQLTDYPRVSILVATYNEQFVISKTLEGLSGLAYPRDRIQVVIADDSTDETTRIIDEKVAELSRAGMATLVSRRSSRQGFKCGALNKAAQMLDGEYVLLLDADSIVTTDILTRGISVFQTDPAISFVSYRMGHYNRDQNIITRLFALSMDLGDTLWKMGSYSIDAPFSFQGGFTLLCVQTLKDVGFWSEDSVVDDADLSCKIYSSGGRGIYLSTSRIFGEAPPILELWKRQAARVSQGWAKCINSHRRMIFGSAKLSLWRKIALLLALASPFSSLSWVVVTFAAAFGILLGLSTPANSVFNNPYYILVVSLPIVSYFASAVYSLYVQKIMTIRNLLLLPLISYTGYGMLASISIGFLAGLTGRTGEFFRTPKSGASVDIAETHYFRGLRLGRTAVAEGVLAIVALLTGAIILQRGVWFLGLALAGFGALTLKSMNLVRRLRPKASIDESKDKRELRTGRRHLSRTKNGSGLPGHLS